MNIKEEFDKIYDETYTNVYKYVVSKCDNINNVDDILQNVYITFYRTIEKKGLDFIENYEAYLIKISKSELFKYYSIKNKFKYIMNISDDNEELDKLENISTDEISLEDKIETKLSIEEIWNIISSGDELTAKIMVFYYKDNLKIKDIANILNIKENSVKTRIYRMIDKLKNNINKGDYYE